ncbi:MAG: hypothetical protein A2986_02840 [Candidatus Jacksonbacteria bacterium RIFCSPLOWO2_01_FULL_44_13]|nr:MAG: hypothetical protein A2986_02840 [Candidatus Jacksonbacteria bacterium RIFCSPLOWO2_01_FULL_44_13]
MGFRYREAVLPDGTRVCALPSGLMESHPHGRDEWHIAEGDCAKLPAKREKMNAIMGADNEEAKFAGVDRPHSEHPADRGLS